MGCHDDSRFPAKYRIYQTATPRVYDLGGKPKKNDNWIVRNMDDQAVFGVELYRKSYVDAVKNQWLSDYRIIALGVNDKHAYDTANSMAKDSGKKLSVTDSLRGLALALVMGGYLKESDTVIRSSINFVNTIKKSKEMTRLLQSQEVRDWVKQRLSDHHNNGDSIAHYCLEHLDADSKVAKREEAKARLAAGTEANPHGIINVGIFGEGTDVQSLSAVGFLEARKSPVDVIQAVGRVMRRSHDKKMGYIICPIVIPSGTDAETWLRNSGPEDGWRELGQILVALRAHDSRIEDELSDLMKLVTPSPPPDDVTTMVTIGQEGYQSEHYIHHGAPDEVVHDVRDMLKGGSDAEDTMIKLEQFDHSSDPERIVSACLNTDGSIEIREDGIQRDKPKPDGTIGPVNFRKSKKRGVEMLNGKAGKIIHYVTTVVTIGRDDHQAEHYIHQGQEGKAETDAVSVLGEQSSDKSKLIELDKIDNPRDLDSDRIISARLKQDDSIEMREAEVQRDKPNSDSILGNLNVEKTKQKGVAMLAGKAGKVIPTPTAKGRKKPDDPLYPYLFDRADSVGITVNLLQKSGLSHNRAKRDANILKDSIQGAAEYLKQDELRPLLDRHFRLDALDDKKRKNQADGCTIAALLLMNACLLHQRIVVGKWLLNVTAMDEIKTSVDTLTKLSDQWNNITRHDFLPVLEPAIEIVRVVRDSGKREGLNRALRHLAAEAEHIAESYADLGADHAGPLFNEVMGNQASDGAYFTRPPAASMVARLSFDVFEQKNGGGANWTLRETWMDCRTTDLACGSGTLLAGVLTEMKRRAREQGANATTLAKLQKLAVEKVITGLDFNPISLQLAAAQLIAGNHSISYKNIGLHRMEYGPRPDGTVAVGSLELLGQTAIVARKDEWNHDYDKINQLDSKRVNLSKGDDPLLEAPVEAVNDVRLVVMNPPFTNRSKQGEKFPKETQQKMRAKADSLEATLIKHDPEMVEFADKNSIEPLFVMLADNCLNHTNGVLSIITPTISMTATSAKTKRRILAKRFYIHTILTSHVLGQVNLSQDTAINESILIAHRYEGAKPPTRIISLDRMPLNEDDVAEFHECLLRCKGGLIQNGWGEVSEWPADYAENGDWSAAVWRSPKLAEESSKFANMESLISLRDQKMIPAATGQVLRGDFQRSDPDMSGSFPILKSKGGGAQTKIMAIPDEHWIPKNQTIEMEIFNEKEHHKTNKILRKAGFLLITAGQGTSSARLTAVASDQKYVGNGWMPVVNLMPNQAKAAAVFLNSTAGRLQIMRHPGKSLLFPSFSAKEVAEVRVPDLSDKHIVELLAECWGHTKDMQVPQFRDGECEVRRLWDHAVATALGWNEGELSSLRELLHKEPFVRGRGYNQYE